MRKAAGLTQRELASLLEREQSFVWRIEKGERRVDLLEFHWICSVMGQSASIKYADIVNGFTRYEAAHGTNAMVAEKGEVYPSKKS